MTSLLRVMTGGRTHRGQLACRAGAAVVAAAACTAAAVAAGSPAAHAQPGRPAAAAHHAARAQNTPCVDTANTPAGSLAQGATVTLTWTTVPGCADGQTGTITVTDQATKNTTIITPAAPLQPRTYHWTVNVPPGTYTLAINDGTGNKYSGMFTVTGPPGAAIRRVIPGPGSGHLLGTGVGAGTGLVAAVISRTQFCSFLPRTPGEEIGASESDATVFCTTAGLTDGARAFPAGFIKTAHFATCGTGCVQVTGTIDPAAYGLSPSDGGGQYDNQGDGSPPGATAQGYTKFVNLVEPSNGQFCIRASNNPDDVDTGRPTAGCESIVPGDYS